MQLPVGVVRRYTGEGLVFSRFEIARSLEIRGPGQVLILSTLARRHDEAMGELMERIFSQSSLERVHPDSIIWFSQQLINEDAEVITRVLFVDVPQVETLDHLKDLGLALGDRHRASYDLLGLLGEYPQGEPIDLWGVFNEIMQAAFKELAKIPQIVPYGQSETMVQAKSKQ